MNLVESGEIPPAIRKWKPYPAYKDSSVEWLGKIPDYWHVKRLKFTARVNMGQSPSSEEYNIVGDGLPFLQGNAEFGVDHPQPKLYCPTARKRTLRGDILLSVRAPVGALNVADQEYGIGRGLCAISPNDDGLANKFARYLLEVVRLELSIVATGSTYEAVSVDEVGSLCCVLPPVREQHTIADFLDRDTAKIDALVKKKGRQIALLLEKRAAIISQAVTKGLDLNVPMKDSGIEWLGKLPAHWTIKRFRFLVESGTQNGLHKAQEFYNADGVPIFSMAEAFASPVIDSTAKDRVTLTVEERRSYALRKGDLLFARRSLVFGGSGKCSMVGDLPEPHIFESSIIRVTPNRQLIEPSFALLFLNSATGRFQILAVTKQVTISGVDSEGLKDLSLPVPPLPEQLNIIGYLAAKTAQIDALIAKVREGIEKLKEYRTALISAAVTGKIDVREEAGTASQLLSQPSQSGLDTPE